MSSFGYAVSADGINFTRDPEPIFVGQGGRKPGEWKTRASAELAILSTWSIPPLPVGSGPITEFLSLPHRILGLGGATVCSLMNPTKMGAFWKKKWTADICSFTGVFPISGQPFLLT